MADRLVAVDPDGIRHHQKRVELAFRMGDRGPLLDAYVSLGDALARAGATDKAMAVFRRVQEHDPGNPHAALALEALAVEAEETERPAAQRPVAYPARPAGAPPPVAEPRRGRPRRSRRRRHRLRAPPARPATTSWTSAR